MGQRAARFGGRARCWVPFFVVVALLGVAGCTPGVRVAPESAVKPTATIPGDLPTGEAAGSGVGTAAVLPNGVPLPAGGLIVAGPTAARERSGVTGWSAVVTLSASEDGARVQEAIRGQLTHLGWQVDFGGSKSAAVRTISARRTMPIVAPGSTGGAEQWIQVTVTDPLIDSGPAVVYRFAEAVP